MPQVKTAKSLFVGLFILCASFIGCSDPNSQAPFNADTGSHAVSWLPAEHMTAATTDINSCSSCHGADYSGGVSGVSCTSCHMGGVTNMHPAGWLGDACTNHGTFVLTSPTGTSGCANAHCHGTNLGGVPQSGPSCTKCHPTIPTQPSCGTCHGIPPDGLAPAGNAYPNLPGKHATHTALIGVTCATCHNRSCDQHLNGTVDVIFDPAYNAETGTASFGTLTGATCGNVSCHGGPRTQRIRTIPPSIYTQVTSASTWTSDPSVTPDWYTGSINLNDTAQCFSCHVYGNTLYNGYFSGQHYFHAVENGFTCIACHDTLKLTNASFHFPNLRAHVISSSTASASTNSWLNYNGTTCTNATSGCHQGETRSWRQ